MEPFLFFMQKSSDTSPKIANYRKRSRTAFGEPGQILPLRLKIYCEEKTRGYRVKPIGEKRFKFSLFFSVGVCQVILGIPLHILGI